MPSHLSDIGFPVASEDEFVKHATTALRFGAPAAVEGGAYWLLAPGEGVELWAQKDAAGEFVGVNPHFSGSARMRVGLTARVTRPGESPLDGAFHAWAGPASDTADPAIGGQYPLVFDVPDFLVHAAIGLPLVVDVQIAAFAEEIVGFENERAFVASQGDETGWAVESFVPVGLFDFSAAEWTEREHPEARAMLSGVVLETRTITNPNTKSDFLWARVRTLGGELDVVTDPTLVSGPVVVGGIVQGTFWLSGRIVTAAPEDASNRRSLWARIKGK